MKEKTIPKKSKDITEERLKKLKKLFPELMAEGKVDLDMLKTFFREESSTEKQLYRLTWAGKEDVFKEIQSETTARLAPSKKESEKFEESKNLFIEGENLEVLKLLQKSYMGKVKMIYIDPPYNIDSQNVYKDKYSTGIEAYLKATEQIDEEGNQKKTNVETTGRHHSEWLNLMYPRLFLSRQLLTDDGVIFVSIDDKEMHNLRFVMDEIFGEENFIATIKRKAARKTAHLRATMSDMCDYIVVYAKRDKNKLSVDEAEEETRPVLNETNSYSVRTIPSGTEAKCKDGEYPAGEYKVRTLVFHLLDDLEIKNGRTSNEVKVRGQFRVKQNTINESVYITKNFGLRRYVSEIEKKKPKIINDLLADESIYNEKGSEELKVIFGEEVFKNPKPVELIKFLIKAVSEPEKMNDFIVMDFFAGTCTTAQAVLEQNNEENFNNKFIMVQFPEKVEKKLKAYKEGFETIAEIGKERIRRVVKGYGDNPKPMDDGFKVFKLNRSVFKMWEPIKIGEKEELIKQMKLFDEIIDEKATSYDVIYEILLKKGYDLNSKIEKIDSGFTELYKVTNYSSVKEYFHICFDKDIDMSLIEELGLTKDDELICPDSSLTNETKTNLNLKVNLEVI